MKPSCYKLEEYTLLVSFDMVLDGTVQIAETNGNSSLTQI